MSLLMTLNVAIKALRRNALRTALTALGMIIGVAAVIVMVAIGTGARSSIENQIQNAGSNLVMINAGSGTFGPVRQGQGAVTTLTADDAEAIREQVAGVKQLTPTLNTRSQLVGDFSNWNTQIQGVNDELPLIRSWQPALGTFFTAQEVRSAVKVVVLGSVTRDELFGVGADPVGATLRINNQPFKVIGVMATKGQAAMGPDQDDVAFVPYTTVQKRLLGVQHINGITISAVDAAAIEPMTSQIGDVLRERHRLLGKEDDFGIRTQAELSTMLTSTTTTMTYLLAGIAAVSLLVGGIGIMNIMLVSVTERTREIGLRLSVGARDLDVLTQFLVEAVVLSLVGGAIGILLGVGVSRIVTQVMNWSTVVTSNSVLLSFGVAAATGVFFGFYPARKAAALDPIDALRFE